MADKIGDYELLPASPNVAGTTKGITDKPVLQLPKLELGDDTSTVNQLTKLKSKDSLLKQQARVDAQEKGVASGAIHSAQQAGAAERAVDDVLTPLAASEANLALTEDVQNWTSASTQMLETYQKDYAARLTEKGIAAEKAVAMAQINSNLTSDLMSSVNSLLNNTDIDFGEEVKQKLVDIYNDGLANTNTILKMGFKY